MRRSLGLAIFVRLDIDAMKELTIQDIETILHRDENRVMEAKKTTGEIVAGMQSGCAFLNTDGGWLLFGIHPKTLKILGQDVADQTRQEIAREMRKFTPAIDLAAQYIDVPGRPNQKVIVIRFPALIGYAAPYTYDNRPYYKVENTTSIMPREMFDERIDTLTVPIKALREATLNLLVQRTWWSGARIPSVAIFDDRIEFMNPGRFPQGSTAEDFRKRPHSEPVNEVISSVFFKSGLMDAWGRAIPDIYGECKAAGLPKPEFESIPNFVCLTIPTVDRYLAELQEKGFIVHEGSRKAAIM